MKERLAIVSGLRTPMQKMGTGLAHLDADELGAAVLRELMQVSDIDAADINEVIIGNCAQPAHAANVARVIALKAGLPKQIPAVTVHRNCASGMESITTAAQRLLLDDDAVAMVAGGVESMSNIPFLFSKQGKAWFSQLQGARTVGQKLGVLSKLRLGFFKPEIGLLKGLTDPVCNMLMGMTAENLAREFSITRDAQDAFALESHNKALAATESGRFKDEMMSMVTGAKKQQVIDTDNGPRKGQTIEALAKLRPYFDRKTGTVTVGTSSQVTDGAAAVTLMTESKAKALGLTPLGYLKAFAYAGCDPHRMGLGPTFAVERLCRESGFDLSTVDVVEINEAFAAQVMANVIAMNSKSFFESEFGHSNVIGEIDPAKLNINGGAIALGHPLGMSGTRLVLTALHQLKRDNKQTALATLCIGGGQGAALWLEAK